MKIIDRLIFTGARVLGLFLGYGSAPATWDEW